MTSVLPFFAKGQVINTMAFKTFSASMVLFTVCQQVSSVTPHDGATHQQFAAGGQGLRSKPLQPCSTRDDKVQAGVTRDGSCEWNPSDTAYHAVCVKMSEKFLKQSASHDGNDLSPVVQNGGHWCICAWAFASAVSRDPKNIEGLELQCDATNGNLRDVYKANQKLQGPAQSYLTENALKKVDELCGGSASPTATPEDAAKALLRVASRRNYSFTPGV